MMQRLIGILFYTWVSMFMGFTMFLPSLEASSWGEEWGYKLKCDWRIIEFNRSKQLVRMNGVNPQRYSTDQWNWFWKTISPDGKTYSFYVFDSNYTSLSNIDLVLNQTRDQSPTIHECSPHRD